MSSGGTLDFGVSRGGYLGLRGSGGPVSFRKAEEGPWISGCLGGSLDFGVSQENL